MFLRQLLGSRHRRVRERTVDSSIDVLNGNCRCPDHFIERLILVSNDTDCVPAMKYGRRSGIQIVVAELPNGRVATELAMHADFNRRVLWP
jgi:hypothetical protein